MSSQQHFKGLKASWERYLRACQIDDKSLRSQAESSINQFEQILGLPRTIFALPGSIQVGMKHAGIHRIDPAHVGGYAPQELAKAGLQQLAHPKARRIPNMLSEPPYPNQPTYGAGQYTTGGPGQLNVPSGYATRNNFNQSPLLEQAIGNSQYSNAVAYSTPSQDLSGQFASHWDDNETFGLGSLNMMYANDTAGGLVHDTMISPQAFAQDVALSGHGPVTTGPTPTAYGEDASTPGRPVSVGNPDPSSPRVWTPITTGPTPTPWGENPNVPGRPVSLTKNPQRGTQPLPPPLSGDDATPPTPTTPKEKGVVDWAKENWKPIAVGAGLVAVAKAILG